MASGRRAIGGSIISGMRHSSSRSAIMASALLLACAAAPLGRAQEATDTGESDAAAQGDIIVTAQRRSENLMDVPVAISAFGGDTLATMNIDDVQALQIVTPALVYPSTGAYAQPYIRGVGSRLLQNGLDPSVATYVDGRYISRQSAIVLDLADVQRVEVLKGPQGVLFGRNAAAGAIRIITNEVGKDREGSFRISAGNYDALTAEAVANVPLGESFGMRISGLAAIRDPYARNLSSGRKDWDDKNLKVVRAKFRLNPGPDFDANLSLSYFRQRDNSGNDTVAVGQLPLTTGIAVGGITGIERDEVATNLGGLNDKRELAGEFTMRVGLGAVDLSTTTTYADLDNILTFDGDGTSARLVDATVFEQSKTFSQEVQLASAGSGPFDWIVGGYYFRDNTDFDTTIDVGTRTVSNGIQGVLTRSWAVFGQGSYDITDSLSLTLGGRFSKDIKSVDLAPSALAGAVTLPVTPFSRKDSWSKFTPSAILEYSFGDSLAYAKFARGFKSGGYNYPAVGQNPLNPEVLDMYELGYKGQLFDRAVRLTLSAYYYDYQDLQVARAPAEGVGSVVVTENAANAELYGVDADLTWFATPDLTFNLAASWQDSKYKDYLAAAKMYRGVLNGTTQPGMVDVGFDASGERLLRAPAFSAFASVNYNLPVGPGTVPMSVTYAYKGAYNFDFVLDPSTSVLRQNAYSLVNARIGYRPDDESWSISLWGNNLFNERYFDDVTGAGVGIRGSYGAPRTYGIEAVFNF